MQGQSITDADRVAHNWIISDQMSNHFMHVRKNIQRGTILTAVSATDGSFEEDARLPMAWHCRDNSRDQSEWMQTLQSFLAWGSGRIGSPLQQDASSN